METRKSFRDRVRAETGMRLGDIPDTTWETLDKHDWRQAHYVCVRQLADGRRQCVVGFGDEDPHWAKLIEPEPLCQNVIWQDYGPNRQPIRLHDALCGCGEDIPQSDPRVQKETRQFLCGTCGVRYITQERPHHLCELCFDSL